MYINPIAKARMSRIAWSLFRHPVRNHDFPAKHERLVTAAELVRYGY